jgi:hypothetical protein
LILHAPVKAAKLSSLTYDYLSLVMMILRIHGEIITKLEKVMRKSMVSGWPAVALCISLLFEMYQFLITRVLYSNFLYSRLNHLLVRNLILLELEVNLGSFAG